MPQAIERLKSGGHTVIDRYKNTKPEIPIHGAFVAFFITFFVCFMVPLLSRFISNMGLDANNREFGEVDIAILLVISMFGMFGVIDDLISFSWRLKIIFPLVFSFPLMVVFSPEFLHIPFIGTYNLSTSLFGEYDYSDFFKIIIILMSRLKY